MTASAKTEDLIAVARRARHHDSAAERSGAAALLQHGRSRRGAVHLASHARRRADRRGDCRARRQAAHPRHGHDAARGASTAPRRSRSPRSSERWSRRSSPLADVRLLAGAPRGGEGNCTRRADLGRRSRISSRLRPDRASPRLEVLADHDRPRACWTRHRGRRMDFDATRSCCSISLPGRGLWCSSAPRFSACRSTR